MEPTLLPAVEIIKSARVNWDSVVKQRNEADELILDTDRGRIKVSQFGCTVTAYQMDKSGKIVPVKKFDFGWVPFISLLIGLGLLVMADWYCNSFGVTKLILKKISL